jgi:hypothetical protein
MNISAHWNKHAINRQKQRSNNSSDNKSTFTTDQLLEACYPVLGRNFLEHLLLDAKREISLLVYVLCLSEQFLAELTAQALEDNYPLLLCLRNLFTGFNNDLVCGNLVHPTFEARKKEKADQLVHLL